MSFSALFIRRPVGTTLLTIALALAGALAYPFLPVSPLPQVEFATIEVQRHPARGQSGNHGLGRGHAARTPVRTHCRAQRNDLHQLSRLHTITLQFDLSRNIDAAARDVQAAINAARGQLPANLPNNPRYRKINPADSPMLIMALTSEVVSRGQMYDVASSMLQQKLSQVEGVGRVVVGGGALPAVRVEVNPTVLNSQGLSLEDVRQALSDANANRPKGDITDGSAILDDQ